MLIQKYFFPTIKVLWLLAAVETFERGAYGYTLGPGQRVHIAKIKGRASSMSSHLPQMRLLALKMQVLTSPKLTCIQAKSLQSMPVLWSRTFPVHPITQYKLVFRQHNSNMQGRAVPSQCPIRCSENKSESLSLAFDALDSSLFCRFILILLFCSKKPVHESVIWNWRSFQNHRVQWQRRETDNNLLSQGLKRKYQLLAENER